MKNQNLFKKIIVGVGILLVLVAAFYVGRKSTQYKVVPTETVQISNSEENHPNSPRSFDAQRNESSQTAKEENNQNYAHASSTSSVPEKAIKVLQYIRENKQAPDGYVGGREFKNREEQLPMNDNSGNKIQYQEWDVNPKIEGKNRGAERLVTSDKDAYYTEDHYRTFTKIEE